MWNMMTAGEVEGLEARTVRDMCTPLLVAALFTLAKGGNSPDTPQQING